MGPVHDYERPDGQQLVDALVWLLDLETIERDIYRGVSPKESLQRVFGGQVAGQALIAAGRTVDPERKVHSLHSYFIRPGDPAVPIVYTVDRVRDGGSFSTRRVVAVQHGAAIFSLSASFQLPQEGIDHQSPMPEAPDPEQLPTALSWLKAHGIMLPKFQLEWPFDLRWVDPPSQLADAFDGPSEEPHRTWMRAAGVLPDDRLLHACALTYASDLLLLDSVLLKHRLSFRQEGLRLASLDHAVWFHRPFRADEWLLYAQESPSASGGRGLAMGRIFTRDGRHVATVMQEGMIRLPSA
ncbi:MAG: acyl-CoA thioesterase II [Actinobacteria bacterium]|nr:acyl-CoA thioesterase II [Actinomycetota bacterium]